MLHNNTTASVALSLLLLLIMGSTTSIDAHSGRTNSEGCYNCNVGSCAGTYHCHNGGVGGYDPPAPVAPIIVDMPSTTVSTNLIQNDNGTYDLTIDWDRPNVGQWSVALSKTAGADPGPAVDTTESFFSFKNVSPGTYFINMKEKMGNGYWSNVSYWSVTVPTWTPPEPTPTDVIPPAINMEDMEEGVTENLKTEEVGGVEPESINGGGNIGLLITSLIGGAHWLGRKQRKES